MLKRKKKEEEEEEEEEDKGLRISYFAFVSVVFKWHRGSERVNKER